jgi:uncharacterized phiE125 gp8 family phage protein
MSITIITPPTVEPITLSEVKANSRIATSADDTLLTALITVARQMTESEIGKALIDTTIDYRTDWCFPAWFDVPRGPLRSVTSVSYVDTAGATQVLAANQYVVDSYDAEGRIVPAYSVSWPSTRLVQNAVTVRYVAGYGAAASAVPLAIRHAILMLVDHLYEHAGSITELKLDETPMAYRMMLAPYRRYY